MARGSRLNVWKTNPISLLRTRASASSDIFETSWPLSQYSPAFGVSRQPMMFMSVDLPEPDGPMMATYSLRADGEIDAAQARGRFRRPCRTRA